MVTQTMGWGTTFSQVGILATPIAEDIGLSRGQVFLGATVLYAFAAITALWAGRLADRLGGLRMLMPGSVVLAVSLWALSYANGVISYIWPWALMGGVFHVGLVTSAYTGLAQALGHRASASIGVLTIATGLCSAVFWPISEWLLGWTDWRGVLRIYALATVTVALPIHALLWIVFGHLRAGQGDGAPQAAPSTVLEGHEKTATRFMIAIASFGSLIGVGFGLAAIEVFTALGAPRSASVLAGSLMGAAYLVSRAIAMVLQRWVTPVRLAQMTYACLPLSLCPLLPYAVTGAELPGGVAISVACAFGLPAGLVGMLRSLLPLYLFGSHRYGERLGVQARVTEAASAVAPFGFTTALAVSAAGMVSGLVLLGGVAFLASARLGAFVQSDAAPENR